MRHVVWCSASLSLGAFFYVVTMAPMNTERTPRAAAIDRVPPPGTLVTNVRRALSRGQLDNADLLSGILVEQYPDDLRSPFYRALVLRRLGLDDQEKEQWVLLGRAIEETIQNANAQNRQNLVYFRAWAALGSGDEAGGQALFAQNADWIERVNAGQDGVINNAGVHFNLACNRAMAGETEVALEHWASAVALGYGGQSGDGGWWMVDPDLESLHTDERFWVIGSRLMAGANRDGRGAEDEPTPGDGG